MTVRPSIKIFAHEDRLLKDMYLARRVPIDQYENRPSELEQFAQEWAARTGRHDSGPDLVHYMRTKRKAGQWPRLNGDHQKRPPLAPFSPEETEVLVDIYYEHVVVFDHGSDSLGYEPEIAKLVAKEFYLRTRRRVRSHHLIAKLTALRKRGHLPKVGKRKRAEDEGLHDIDRIDDAG